MPASSANLGPGFDALGLALGLWLECDVRASERLSISVAGRDAASIPACEQNLIWRTASAVAVQAGRRMPPVELAIRNQIPLGSGLGSSAAAVTAGVVMADALLALRLGRSGILNEAARLEGHPDNVAACILGSFVASALDPAGVAFAVRLELPNSFGVAVVVPDFVLPTSQARSVLPDCYSREDAIFNVQRAALLTAALATGSVDAFPTALEDRFHQPYRVPLVSGLAEILELRAPGLLGCALSGAGPSVLVFYKRGHEEVCELPRQVFERHGHAAEIWLADVPPEGYELKELAAP